MIYSDTNSMVEEFMLLANIYTAQKTLEEFPQCAVLRRHPAPPQSNYEPLIKVAEAKVSYIISLYASCLSR
jgi:exosome complex exonuclease DIS3/RRP44